jgi:uncharacterized protein Yka (UPF0111/DUF47 family)
MYDEQMADTPKEKRTLVNAVSKIHGRINNLEDAARMSEMLLEKLMQTEDEPKPDKVMGNEVSPKRRDLIDNLESASERIENLSDRVCRNLDQALQMIG